MSDAVIVVVINISHVRGREGGRVTGRDMKSEVNDETPGGTHWNAGYLELPFTRFFAKGENTHTHTHTRHAVESEPRVL